MARVATLPPQVTNKLKVFQTFSSHPLGIEHISQVQHAWRPIWLVNRAVAEAYGLTPDDFEYILSTFPVFARKRPEFYAYLQERVQEWKHEAEGSEIYAMLAAGPARAAETPQTYSPKALR
ncbi:MAG: hypothetical protein KatS3mg077_2966 [Candidatus Binatia bacterium]|nr:MAG: hypothetical protein KatS3mg077_2966 [Candidatus Binatia bacterium]